LSHQGATQEAMLAVFRSLQHELGKLQAQVAALESQAEEQPRLLEEVQVGSEAIKAFEARLASVEQQVREPALSTPTSSAVTDEPLASTRGAPEEVASAPVESKDPGSKEPKAWAQAVQTLDTIQKTCKLQQEEEDKSRVSNDFYFTKSASMVEAAMASYPQEVACRSIVALCS